MREGHCPLWPKNATYLSYYYEWHSGYTERSAITMVWTSISLLEDSLQFESENALHVISKESIGGAQKFVEGLGENFVR